MRTLTTGIVAGLVLLLALVVPVVAVNFHDPVEITTDGAVYTLDQNVGNSPATAFVVVKADNVEIDGQGFTLDGRDQVTSKGIVVERYLKNNVYQYPEGTYIHDITLSDWGYGVSVYEAEVAFLRTVFYSNIQGVLFKSVHGFNPVTQFQSGMAHCRVEDNRVTGVYIQNGHELRFESVVFEDNADTATTRAMYILGTTMYPSYQIVVDGCLFAGNKRGIDVDGTAYDFRATGNTFTDNGNMAGSDDYAILLEGDSYWAWIYQNAFYANEVGVAMAGNTWDNDVQLNDFQMNMFAAIYLLDAVEDNIFWDNYFDNWHNVRFEVGMVGDNAWSLSAPVAGPNVIGGPEIGGNYWAQPDMMGWSQTYFDVADIFGNIGPDGFTDMPFEIADGNVDDYPLHM